MWSVERARQKLPAGQATHEDRADDGWYSPASQPSQLRRPPGENVPSTHCDG
jgi:hypothetical protein